MSNHLVAAALRARGNGHPIVAAALRAASEKKQTPHVEATNASPRRWKASQVPNLLVSSQPRARYFPGV